MRLIGNRIRQLRIAAGISQEQLANDAEISRSYIAEVESGNRNVSVVLICEIANALAVEPFQLLRFDLLPKKARR
jgi:transcriptional regulator with XRE-family HTH domain